MFSPNSQTLRAVLDSLPAQIALLDSEGVIQAVNDSWRRFASANQLPNRDFLVGCNYLDLCDRTRGEAAEQARLCAQGIREVLDGSRADFTLEYPCHSETEQRWFRLIVTPLAGDPQSGALVTHVDITEGKLTEQKLDRINRLYLVLSRINEGIVRVPTEEDLIRAVCKIIVEQGEFKMAAVVQADDQTGQVRPRAFFPLEDRYLEEVAVSVRDPKLNQGSIGTCLRIGAYDVCNDLANDARVAVWKETFMPRGYRSSASFPIIAKGQVIAALALFAGESNFFQKDEIKLLQMVAGDVSFAIESLRMETSLRDRQMLLNSAQRIGRMGSWSIDFRSGRLAWSDTTCEIFGITPADFRHTIEHFLSFVIPEDRPAFDEAHSRVSPEHPFLEMEYRIRRPDSQIRTLYERGNVEYDDTGAQVRRFGMVMDITEAKANREALAESEKRFRTLFELAPDPIFVHDFAGAFLDQNKAAEACLGYSRSEVLGRSFASLNLFSSEELAKAQEALQENARGKSVGPLELTVQRRDGSTFPLEIRTYPLTLGKQSLVLTVGRDVSERKRAESQLRDQAKLLDAAHEAIIVKKLDGTITFWNKGAQRLYGWTPDEILGQLSFDLLYRNPDAFHRAKGELLAQGQWEGEMEKITKDGRNLNVKVSLTLVRDDRGAPQSILAINSDITEKKRLEAQFLRAQRMESIGTLAGGIAHDLNNVLAPILFSVELLKPLAQTPEDQSLLDTLAKSAQRGSDLVRQVLSFARGIEGQRVTVNLLHLARDLVKVMRETFPKDIEIEFKTKGDLWTVTGDATQIHQVLLNLCVNARDAMPAGGKITLGIENLVLDETYAAMNPEAGSGPHVMIKVADTGTGIPPEIRDRIFEPFFTTKTVGKGTGLGLSTTRAIVKSHGGFINCYSEVGKGTKFKVYFPADATHDASAERGVVDPKLPFGRGELLLLVDDEQSIRDVARRSLERFGYKVLTASNGAEALAVYVRRQPEIAVVITDMAMPIMDGPALIIALKSINPQVRIIGSSGLASNDGVTKSLGAGVQHFIPKPYTAEAMLNTLDQLLRPGSP